jgi:nucleoside-diphosphate-sugar epimerase
MGGLKLTVFNGKQTRNFMHIRNVKDMIALVLKSEVAIGETFNCEIGREVSVNELVSMTILIS